MPPKAKFDGKVGKAIREANDVFDTWRRTPGMSRGQRDQAMLDALRVLAQAKVDPDSYVTVLREPWMIGQIRSLRRARRQPQLA